MFGIEVQIPALATLGALGTYFVGGTASEVALAMAAAGTGSILVALVLPRLLERVRDRPVMLWGAPRP